MRKTTLFLLLLLLVEAAVLGLLYFEKTNRASAPMPNLASTDELTRIELKTLIENCVTAEQWAELARMFMGQGFYPEAKSAFKRACELDPDSNKLAFDYGFCLGRTGNIEESNRQLERAIELGHSKSVEATFFIARNHLRAGDTDAAEVAFRKSKSLSISKYELAKLLYRKGELDDAETVAKELLSEEKDTVQSLSLLSNIRKKKGDKLNALGNSIASRLHWSRRIPTPFGKERSKLMDSYGKIGYGKLLNEMVQKTNQRKNLEARKGLQELLEMEWNLAAHESLVKCTNQSSRTNIAIDLINERIKRFGPSSKWYARLGETYLQREEVEKALEAWKIGAKLNSDEFGKNCYRNLARYYIEQKYDMETSYKYQKVGIIGFSTEALGSGEYSKALPFATKAVELAPESAEAHYKLGETLVGLGRLEGALEAFKKCVELEPTHGRGIMQLRALGVE